MRKTMIILFFLIFLLFFIPMASAADEKDRLAGSNRFETAVEISKAGWNKADTVILSTASNFPDALAGGPLAKEIDAPILLVQKDRLTDTTRAEMERLKASEVIILGGGGVISELVVTEVKAMGLTVERIGGKDRYETAAKIAERMEKSDTAFVVYGDNFPDALSIAPYAGQEGHPILLTRTASLPEVTREALRSVDHSFVIGGSSVVSDDVMNELPDATRVSGNNRFRTSAEIIRRFQMDADNVYIATGYSFPDALTGSVLAAKNNGAVILTKTDTLPVEMSYLLNQKLFERGIALGGTKVVSEEVASLVRIMIARLNLYSCPI
ncbi:cell wall-binding repeat-containing protein [Halobacillus kuroshimensis]|uniref:cell wall-binding repeat-containing protein n=1 Tax=Halobacillus kuroshimensis TaxID=302481 RepID=UPI0006842693|nr:cell wall-binding repeat-containing protein [Halobacillus kuroshimensis]